MKKTEARKEYKFILDSHSKSKQLFFIRKDYKKLHPSRKITSLYFDTIDLKIYRNSLDVDVDKFKVRFRQYNNIGDIYKEIKLNLPNGRKKEIEKTSYKSLEQIKFSYYRGLNLFPVVKISFDREYFYKGGVRITIDSNLEAKVSKFFNLAESTYYSDKNIVEYKLNNSFKEHGNELSKKLLIDESISIEDYFYNNPVSFSKYTYSIEKLFKNISQ